MAPLDFENHKHNCNGDIIRFMLLWEPASFQFKLTIGFIIIFLYLKVTCDMEEHWWGPLFKEENMC